MNPRIQEIIYNNEPKNGSSIEHLVYKESVNELLTLVRIDFLKQIATMLSIEQRSLCKAIIADESYDFQVPGSGLMTPNNNKKSLGDIDLMYSQA